MANKRKNKEKIKKSAEEFKEYQVSIRQKTGRRMRHIRRGKNVTQKELAQKMGVKPATLSKMEAGTAKPSLKVLLGYSFFLEVPLDSFIEPAGPSYVDPDLSKLIANNYTLYEQSKIIRIIDEIISLTGK